VGGFRGVQACLEREQEPAELCAFEGIYGFNKNANPEIKVRFMSLVDMS
jgi:hypothetical protein